MRIGKTTIILLIIFLVFLLVPIALSILCGDLTSFGINLLKIRNPWEALTSIVISTFIAPEGKLENLLPNLFYYTIFSVLIIILPFLSVNLGFSNTYWKKLWFIYLLTIILCWVGSNVLTYYLLMVCFFLSTPIYGPFFGFSTVTYGVIGLSASLYMITIIRARRQLLEKNRKVEAMLYVFLTIAILVFLCYDYFNQFFAITEIKCIFGLAEVRKGVSTNVTNHLICTIFGLLLGALYRKNI